VITATSDVTPSPRGLFVFSLNEAGRAHLFIYSPLSLTLTRLTADPWDDITPALSPDGSQVAFASRRNGYLDLYLLRLGTGEITRLTDTPEYDASPSWSPDGNWLAYVSYLDDNLEVLIRSATDPSQPPIRLTEDPAADHSPAWSPQGRQIAFVSDRSGEDEAWIADLDRAGEERFVTVSPDPQGSQAHPAWSPDGEGLAWATTDPSTGLTSIQVWDARTPDFPARTIGMGDWPIWQDPSHIAALVTTSNQTYLTAYALPSGDLSLPPLLLPGTLRGLSYGLTVLPSPLPQTIQGAAALTPAPLYQPVVAPQPGIPAGRAALVTLQGVQAPDPRLQDVADESFQALRQRVAAETGWDILADLENANVPLTTPLDPGLSQDWLYTGRAFSLKPVLVNAGLISVVREDFGQQTYWRVFISTRAQDGSQGEPLHGLPWDFSTRYSSSNLTAFEQGGSLMSAIPKGYWLDFTALALQYGWERLPALTNWRTYFNGARFNEFALTQGLTWRDAMLELYPPEALITPTVVIPPTRTPTRTPWGYKPPTPTRTLTPQPTFTPSP
jgi:TolB protein